MCDENINDTFNYDMCRSAEYDSSSANNQLFGIS